MNKIVAIYTKVGNILWNLLVLNALWLVFTVLGLGIFGVFPATIAMYSIIRKLHQERSVPLFRYFFEVYKKEFKRANFYGLIILAFLYLIVVALRALTLYPTVYSLLLRFFLIIGLALLVITTMYFLTLYVNVDFENKLDPLKMALLIGIKSLFWNIGLLAIAFSLNYVLIEISMGILFFIGGSLNASLLYLGTHHIYKSYQVLSSAEL